ncbi:ubiquitin carboxyl-terminal hydrolase hypothetical protein [Limosa lapponica baueri]|uniref:ubiquitinyl hydrolase 1 n=1 Tax=Limosa lapponica baueri TaxID=1758121 RepID=A0A2I0T236_LIMLA|nr:ubiquitin carboxyl-terminal hydrolase hypothetical protein [Limosa lapponica baueri]
MAEMRKQSVARGKIKHEEVKELYKRLPAEAGSPYDFISLEWLQKWLDESTPPKPIDNTACLCSHGKLHPDKIPIMKRISEYVADFFYRRYGGGPRLNGKVSGWETPSPVTFWMWFRALFWSQPHPLSS